MQSMALSTKKPRILQVDEKSTWFAVIKDGTLAREIMFTQWQPRGHRPSRWQAMTAVCADDSWGSGTAMPLSQNIVMSVNFHREKIHPCKTKPGNRKELWKNLCRNLRVSFIGKKGIACREGQRCFIEIRQSESFERKLGVSMYIEQWISGVVFFPRQNEALPG